MSATDANEITSDAFLGGQLTIRQPKTGFRAGLDSVLLAAVVRAKKADLILDAGAGVGVASLCLAARQPGATIRAVDSNTDMVRLCADNIAANNLADRVAASNGDVFDLPAQQGRDIFDHVITNPPFHDGTRERPSPSRSKAAAHGFEGPYEVVFSNWIEACLAVLKTKGRIWIINRAEALPVMLAALDGTVGEIEICPLWPKAGVPAKRVIVTARKGAKGPSVLHPGFVLHQENGSFTPDIDAVLRDGRALPI